MDLYIVGAGNVGGFLAYHGSDMGNYNIVGFLDDNVDKHGSVICNKKVIGGLDYLKKINKKVAVVIAIADPSIKRDIINKLKSLNHIEFPVFIHPNSWIGQKVTISEGSIIYPGVTINYESDLSSFSIVNMNCSIGHNCKIGMFSTISPGVNLGGFTEIKACTFMGIGATTKQGIIIGENVSVGGMTMVTKNIEDNVLVFGNPGRIVKKI